MIGKIYTGLISILLAIIGFFLMATYNKIAETNLAVNDLRVQLAKIEEKNSNFITELEVLKIIERYHPRN